MKPFEISLEYLVKSRLNRELLERMIAAMGGISNEEKEQMLAQHELTDWNRAAAKGGLGSVGVTQPNPKGRDWFSEEHMQNMFPSLRHKEEQPDYLEEDAEKHTREWAHKDEMRDIDAGHLEGKRLVTNRWGNENWKTPRTNEQELADKVRQFKQSGKGQMMLENLKERQRNRKLEQITGVPAPPMPPIGDVIHEHLDEHFPKGSGERERKDVQEQLTGAATGMTEEDRALLHHLKGGNTEPLEFLQAHGQGETPLIGDMPLQAFEQTYPTEMPVPQDLPPSVNSFRQDLFEPSRIQDRIDEGSLSQQMGFAPPTCPICGASSWQENKCNVCSYITPSI